MKKIHTDLFAVINRFPDRKEIIKKLFLKSKAFQGMCEDYRLCQDALDFWTRSENKNAAKPREDYSVLINELEAEIIRKLDEST